MGETVQIKSANDSDFRVLAVSAAHIKGVAGDVDFLEFGKRKFKVEKDSHGHSIFWEWEKGNPFTYGMAKLSAAAISPKIVQDYGIEKIYFYLVSEV